MSDETCSFCDPAALDVVARMGPCIAIRTNEPPAGSLMVIPVEHRKAPWDLTSDEWTATHELLRSMRLQVQENHQPDGWNVGWNVGRVGGQSVEHAHCHLVPRYKEEQHAGKGLRWLFKQPQNTQGTRGFWP